MSEQAKEMDEWSGRIHGDYILQSVASLQALNDNDLGKGKNDLHLKKDLLCDDSEDSSAYLGKSYQLYTLYRDKDGNIRQVTDLFFLFFEQQILKLWLCLEVFIHLEGPRALIRYVTLNLQISKVFE